MNLKFLILIFCIHFLASFSFSQDDRNQIPVYMQSSFFEVNVGYIHYPFDAEQLNKGFLLADEVEIPNIAVRLVLAGYSINKYLSAQITYMRPVNWVKYSYSLEGDATNQVYTNSVWMNVGGLTLAANWPIGKRWQLYAKGGLALVTRHGFSHWNGPQVIDDFTAAGILTGAGIKFHLNQRWSIQWVTDFSFPIKKYNQPYTFFTGGGFTCKLLPFSEKKIEKGNLLNRYHPLQWLQIGYTSNVLGYGVNNFLSEGKVPVFWGGKAEVKQGFSVVYQRNVFHGAKIFSLDWGANISWWQSNVKQDQFMTFSLFPVFRFNFLHNKIISPYFYYSVAGPTLMTKKVVDDFEMGGHFTFMDNIGLGCFAGEKQKLNFELRIGHYSNGNIFPENKSVKVPLSLNVGMVF